MPVGRVATSSATTPGAPFRGGSSTATSKNASPARKRSASPGRTSTSRPCRAAVRRASLAAPPSRSTIDTRQPRAASGRLRFPAPAYRSSTVPGAGRNPLHRCDDLGDQQLVHLEVDLGEGARREVVLDALDVQDQPRTPRHGAPTGGDAAQAQGAVVELGEGLARAGLGGPDEHDAFAVAGQLHPRHRRRQRGQARQYRTHLGPSNRTAFHRYVIVAARRVETQCTARAPRQAHPRPVAQLARRLQHRSDRQAHGSFQAPLELDGALGRQRAHVRAATHSARALDKEKSARAPHGAESALVMLPVAQEHSAMNPRLHWSLAATLLLVGCESMPDPGAPFTPVPVATAPAASDDATTTGGEPTAGDDSEWDIVTFEISSEELLAPSTPGAAAQPDTATTAASAEAPATAAAPTVVAPPVTAPMPTSSTSTPIQPQLDGAQPAEGWPLRLISTVPQAFPPRAIIGLPDGTETVVSPGSMLADHQVVVISIGASNIQLAQVSSRGDHAAIAPITLFSQY